MASRSARSTASRRVTSPRSEEHTSELQSQSNLVCRLLLEKKNDAVRDAVEELHLQPRQLRPDIPAHAVNGPLRGDVTQHTPRSQAHGAVLRLAYHQSLGLY